MKRLLLLVLAAVLGLTPVAWSQSRSAARFETVQFQSKLVGKTLPYNVVLPAEYERAPNLPYPVLYLLHGLGDHADGWRGRSFLTDYAAENRLIIVTPEGGDSWYTDSATVPGDRYESYLIQELIPDVESRYRTVKSRAGRAIAGLSMGGYGAIKLGVKYPDRFSFAASTSGALAVASYRTEADLPKSGPLEQSILRTFGRADGPVKAANDLFKLVGELPDERIASLPFLYLDCGTEDFLLQSSRGLDRLLSKRKIPHQYRELPGDHNFAYWRNRLPEIFRIAEQRMTSQP